MRKREKSVVNIFWMRRDLRIEDNIGLFNALRMLENVLPLFIFDTNLFNSSESKNNLKINFLHKTLNRLKSQLNNIGSDIYVTSGNPVEVFKSLANEYHITNVYANNEYEPYSRQRDSEVEVFLNSKNIELHKYKDHVIFEKDELVKADGKPYTQFLAYKKKFLQKLNKEVVHEFYADKYSYNFFRISGLSFPTVEELGFEKTETDFPIRRLSSRLLENYIRDKEFPALNGSSRLSVHVRFGTISIRTVTAFAMIHSEGFLNELIWRNFFSSILWFYPWLVTQPFKMRYDKIRWENNKDHYKKWCEGETGYPLVDAGIRELNKTGYINNRVRMVVASFLVKHLLTDWKIGEEYFAEKLVDYDLASNNGNWQWIAGTGCESNPYFRVFNPVLQAEKFDKEFEYIKRWVPEFGTPDYPEPIVNHKEARERVIERYSEVVYQEINIPKAQ
jgi:deoxyribodipyrimidine photo-lyase